MITNNISGKIFDEYRLDKYIKIQLESSGKSYKNKTKEELEKKLCKYLNLKQCKLTESGREAIFLALKILNAEGKTVAVPAITHYSLLDSIIRSGAKPIFLDCDIKNLNVSSKNLDKNLNNAQIFLLPHMFSATTDLDKIHRICKRKKIKIIEDISQIVGAKKSHKYIGDLVLLSLSPYKPLSAPYGSLGALLTNEKDTNIKNSSKNFKKEQIAHILLKLEKLDIIIDSLIKTNKRYKKNLSGVKEIEIPELGIAAQEFVIFTERKKELESYLKSHMIPLERPYTPLNIIAEKKYGIANTNNMSNSMLYYKKATHLPVFPMMTDKEIDYISKNIINFFNIIK